MQWTAVFERMDCELEMIYVNDGSEDRTLKTLHDLQTLDPRIKIVDLSVTLVTRSQ
jgi:hypothetical protein